MLRGGGPVMLNGTSLTYLHTPPPTLSSSSQVHTHTAIPPRLSHAVQKEAISSSKFRAFPLHPLPCQHGHSGGQPRGFLVRG